MSQQPEHQHPEAFMVMLYQALDGSAIERVWNSRDGVTPFAILLRSGQEARHVMWQQDYYCPNHFEHMNVGERYFTDLDPEAALAHWEKMIDEEWWDHPEYPMSRRFATKEEAARTLMQDFRPGQPTIKEKM